MATTAAHYRKLTTEELEAIEKFAKEFGRTWKRTLSDVYWYNARLWLPRDESDTRKGSLLHGLRNSHGPSWLDGFKLPKE